MTRLLSSRTGHGPCGCAPQSRASSVDGPYRHARHRVHATHEEARVHVVSSWRPCACSAALSAAPPAAGRHHRRSMPSRAHPPRRVRTMLRLASVQATISTSCPCPSCRPSSSSVVAPPPRPHPSPARPSPTPPRPLPRPPWRSSRQRHCPPPRAAPRAWTSAA